MKTASQYFEFFFTKAYRKFKEKNINWGGVRLKYIYKNNNRSNILIIILSACTRKGIKARYNYMNTLSRCRDNQLYILDDFGYDGRGAYYLGKNGGNEIELSCIHLINEICQKTNPDKIIFCGSSKGGWAALNFMTEFKNSIAIIGAPQYKLADYLLKESNEITGKYVLPENEKDGINSLNDYVKNKLCKADSNKVYLHFSDMEHTYNEHIIYLLKDLKNNDIDCEVEQLHYTEHWDVGKHFPQWLIRSLLKEGCSFK